MKILGMTHMWWYVTSHVPTSGRIQYRISSHKRLGVYYLELLLPPVLKGAPASGGRSMVLGIL